MSVLKIVTLARYTSLFKKEKKSVQSYSLCAKSYILYDLKKGVFKLIKLYVNIQYIILGINFFYIIIVILIKRNTLLLSTSAIKIGFRNII